MQEPLSCCFPKQEMQISKQEMLLDRKRSQIVVNYVMAHILHMRCHVNLRDATET